jgi:(p)ppGpp synthase/HD superfamily hydrolase
LRRFEHKDEDRALVRVTISLGDDARGAPTAVEVIRDLGASAQEVDYDCRPGADEQLAVTLDVQVPARVDLRMLVERLAELKGVRRVRAQARGEERAPHAAPRGNSLH